MNGWIHLGDPEHVYLHLIGCADGLLWVRALRHGWDSDVFAVDLAAGARIGTPWRGRADGVHPGVVLTGGVAVAALGGDTLCISLDGRVEPVRGHLVDGRDATVLLYRDDGLALLRDGVERSHVPWPRPADRWAGHAGLIDRGVWRREGDALVTTGWDGQDVERVPLGPEDRVFPVLGGLAIGRLTDRPTGPVTELRGALDTVVAGDVYALAANPRGLVAAARDPIHGDAVVFQRRAQAPVTVRMDVSSCLADDRTLLARGADGLAWCGHGRVHAVSMPQQGAALWEGFPVALSEDRLVAPLRAGSVPCWDDPTAPTMDVAPFVPPSWSPEALWHAIEVRGAVVEPALRDLVDRWDAVQARMEPAGLVLDPTRDERPLDDPHLVWLGHDGAGRALLLACQDAGTGVVRWDPRSDEAVWLTDDVRTFLDGLPAGSWPPVEPPAWFALCHGPPTFDRADALLEPDPERRMHMLIALRDVEARPAFHALLAPEERLWDAFVPFGDRVDRLVPAVHALCEAIGTDPGPLVARLARLAAERAAQAAFIRAGHTLLHPMSDVPIDQRPPMVQLTTEGISLVGLAGRIGVCGPGERRAGGGGLFWGWVADDAVRWLDAVLDGRQPGVDPMPAAFLEALRAQP